MMLPASAKLQRMMLPTVSFTVAVRPCHLNQTEAESREARLSVKLRQSFCLLFFLYVVMPCVAVFVIPGAGEMLELVTFVYFRLFLI